MRIAPFLGCMFSLIIFVSSAQASGFLLEPKVEPETSRYLLLSAGYFDILDNDKALDLRAEIRFGESLIHGIKPLMALETTSDGNFYVAGGFFRDFWIFEDVFFTPSLTLGGYEDGGGKDLGYGLEFRSQIEIGYVLENDHRISLGFSHISNLSLGDENPGAEVLSIYYHIPLDDHVGTSGTDL